MTDFPISRDLLEYVGRLVGLLVPDADLDPLQAALANQVAASDVLRSLQLDDLEPIVSFDPRWL